MGARSHRFYSQHSPITDPGGYAHLYDPLPDAIPDLVAIVQGLLIPPYAAILALHNVHPDEIDNAGYGLRPVEAMLERLLSIQALPLAIERPPQRRLGVNCRNFATLLVSMLRHKGTPARLRVGFAGYLGGKVNYEHRITEYWDVHRSRWVLVDAWIDDVLHKARDIGFSPLDIPRGEHFYNAGHVWLMCRQNACDPSRFGDSDSEVGMPMIRYALLHDLDALNKLEVLGSDAWGGLAVKPEEELTPEDLDYLDQVATLTTTPDAHLDRLLEVHEGSDYGRQVRAEAAKLGLR